mgnify:CR=1 FL=1
MEMGFNPRSRTGSDAEALAALMEYNRFQSTLPHGERPKGSHSLDPKRMFQSTLPHGERRLGSCFHSNIGQFQSTLPHGERR